MSVVGGDDLKRSHSGTGGHMRRTRLNDVTGAVTDVSDGGDLEGMPFLLPVPATRLTDAADVTSIPAAPGIAAVTNALAASDDGPLPGIGPMPVVATALPEAAAASVHSIGSPAQNAALAMVDPNGATSEQVRQALNATNLGFTGAGFTVGVMSDSFNNLGGAAADYGRALPPASQVNVLKDLPIPPPSGVDPGTDEGRAMMQIVHDIAPGANQAFYTASISQVDFAKGILALANTAGCRVILRRHRL